MVDQVKVVADDQVANSRYGAISQTDIFSLLPLAVPLVRGCLWGLVKQSVLPELLDHFVYMIIGFMLFFVMRAMGELLLSNLEYNLLVTSSFRSTRAVGRIFHRLDLLVLLGCNRYGRRGGDHGLCSVWFPVTPDGRLAGGDSAAADAQSRHRENVR